jgi:hypothetical protein
MNEQAKLPDQFDRWRHAVGGNPLELERHNPPSGYFRRPAGEGRWEAIAVWRNAPQRNAPQFHQSKRHAP